MPAKAGIQNFQHHKAVWAGVRQYDRNSVFHPKESGWAPCGFTLPTIIPMRAFRTSLHFANLFAHVPVICWPILWWQLNALLA
jgi:hypothetical protein